MGRAFVEPQKRISASGSLLSPKINDLEPARGRTVRGAECYGLELVSSFRGGRIHRTEHLGKGNDVVACGERDFHVVKIDSTIISSQTCIYGAPERRTAFRQTSKPSKLAESLGRNLSATHTMDLVPGASDTEAPSAYGDRKSSN